MSTDPHALRGHISDMQPGIFARALDAADRVGLLISRVWRTLISLIRRGRVSPSIAQQQIMNAVAAMPGQIQEGIAGSLTSIASTTKSKTAKLVSKLPKKKDPKRPSPQLRSQRGSTRAGVLVKAPDRETVSRIVYSSGWLKRIAAQSKLASPEAIAAIVARGYSEGKNVKQIAADLLPVLQGVQSSARRVARTEGMRIAHEIQFATWEQMGDLVIGYQVHSVHDDHVRPEHKKRDGTIYYKNPKAGQKGIDEMPRPPIEADGSVAHNCRCYLTPVFRRG
jgi:SPP1 gp7 family putative phage head morphogenesis protein